MPKLQLKQRYTQVVLDSNDEVVLVRLKFHPSMAGQRCSLLPSADWTVGPAGADDDGGALEQGRTLIVRPNGKVAFLLRRKLESKRGSVRVELNGYVTQVPFVEVSPEDQLILQTHPSIANSLGF